MPQAISFQTSDPRPKYFDPIIRRIQDTGITDFYFKRHMPPRGMKNKADEPNEPIVLDHLFIPLVYCVSSSFLAIAIFIWEMYWNHSTSVLQINRKKITNIEDEYIPPMLAW